MKVLLGLILLYFSSLVYAEDPLKTMFAYTQEEKKIVVQHYLNILERNLQKVNIENKSDINSQTLNTLQAVSKVEKNFTQQTLIVKKNIDVKIIPEIKVSQVLLKSTKQERDLIALNYLNTLNRELHILSVENKPAINVESTEEIKDVLQKSTLTAQLESQNENDEVLSGDLSILINSEVAHNWEDNETQNSNELSFNMYSLMGVQLTENVDFKLEASIETQGAGEYLALKKPLMSVDSLTLAYQTDLYGVGVGKFDLLTEGDLISPIWGRQLSIFNSLPNNQLDLSGAIGIRTWFNFGELFDQDHYLYVGAFFLDNTRLGKPFFNQPIEDTDDLNDVGYTRKLNNFVLSLHGELPRLNEDWFYAAGIAKLKSTNATQLDETNIFVGIYGDNELPSQLSVTPYMEFLHQNNAEGENKKGYSGLAGITYEDGNWYYGGSLSYQHVKNNTTNQSNNTKEAQIYISYYFDFGGYLDFGYQFIYEDKKNNNQLAISFGIPLEFNQNLYGKNKIKAKETQASDIKKLIRR